MKQKSEEGMTSSLHIEWFSREMFD